MNRFQLDNGTTVDSSRDIHYSTRYDDREFVRGGNNKEKLDWLSTKLEGEISLSSTSIIKLERLRDRYQSDGLAAQAENDIGFYMRYVHAYERINIILENYYRPLHPVGKGGKLNV
jgi:hypothetical protein